MTKTYWWAKPYSLLFFFVVPVYLVLFAVGSSRAGTTDYFTFEYFVLGLIYLTVMGGVSFVASRVDWPSSSQQAGIRVSARFLDVVALATVAAYVIWFEEVIRNPQLLIQVLSGRAANVRGEVATIPGLTTFTQLGIVYCTLYASYLWIWKARLLPRFKLYFYVILFLAAFRSLVWSERLAFIEVVLPVLLIYFSSLKVRSRIARVAVWLGPFAGFAVLMLFFGSAEFFRSWAMAYQFTSDTSFTSFVTERLYYYYFSSVNNGAGLLSAYSWPAWTAQHTFNWLFNLPAVGKLLATYAGVRDVAAPFLESYGDLEFNTFSGIFPVFYDWGIIGAITYSALTGGFIGYCYRHFRNRAGFGVVLYPVLYVSLAEILRILYLGSQRVVPFLPFLIIGYLAARMPQRARKTDDG